MNEKLALKNQLKEIEAEQQEENNLLEVDK